MTEKATLTWGNDLPSDPKSPATPTTERALTFSIPKPKEETYKPNQHNLFSSIRALFMNQRDLREANGVPNPKEQTDEPNQHRPFVSILTLLLSRRVLREANCTLVEGLLSLDSSRWVPYADISLNPIKCAIDIVDEQLLQMLIDYCINCAKKYHPAYMAPVEQCLAKLLEHYPDIAANVFRATSYIPVPNHAYVASHAVGVSGKVRDLLSTGGSKTRPIDIHDESTVFMLRSQLPITTTPKYFLLNGSNARFPHHGKKQAAHKNRSHKIYVSPFQFRPIAAQGNHQHTESVFVQIAKKGFFENPAVVATLRFKWYKFSIHFWFLRFSLSLLFFILVLVVTAKQITVSSVVNPTTEDLAARYLPKWRPVFIATIVSAFMLIAYEVLQMIFSRSRYFW
ncbi:hypothetical protein BGZ65_005000 [Modicella reniformis]|uniref:Uncharacterized protein n=1 Tax=Modicella reniformis TaxID=1440133 RepID=A0A9P6IY73_9FUNG|nr:hypothetical protein BGZ65_005000 [Modicella reniformis]